jgi:signal transduction histidine kinase
MTRADSRGLTIKAALALGFGATFGLWLFAGYYFTERMRDVQRESATVNRRYMEAQELLSSVRTQVLMGSLHVRDALIDPSPDAVGLHRVQVLDSYARIDKALQAYVPILNSSVERGRVNGLRREIDGFRATLLQVLDSDPSTWRTQAHLLIGQVMPRRTSVMQVSDDIQKLNRSAFVQQQEAVAAIYASTQRSVWMTLGLAVAGTLGIALFATGYVGRLETDLQRKRDTERQITDDLQRLSKELVRVQEEERRTIARELHDEVGQVLMAIKVELSLAQKRLESEGSSPGMLAPAQSITDGALHTVRDLSHLLHPALLDDLGLNAALDWYLKGFAKRHGLEVELLHDGMGARLVPEIEAAIYRIVQEAMTNVVKHARATFALVYLRSEQGRLQVSIEDNGVGFDPAVARRGLGLIGIRERVAHLGGTVHVDSAPGKGTRVTLELPARERQPSTDPGDFDAPRAGHPITSKREVLLG